MHNYQNIAEDILWIGGNDHRLSLFENLFPLPGGVSYNNYLVLDEKVVLFDTSDVSVADQFLENLKAGLAGRKPDYLFILHMEPDHCSQLEKVVSLYPDVTLVGSAQTFNFIRQFFPSLEIANKQVVKEGDVISTGKHSFRFVTAPMVHWPEVLFAYDETDHILFSADAFGSFKAVEGSIFADDHDFEKEFLDEARRYYANIVGKFGPQVQAVLKKAAGLDIRTICPLHGPVWRDNLSFLLDKYQAWSTGTPETQDTLVVYGSLYGHTASAAQAFAAKLRKETGKNVSVFDVSGTDVSFLISEVWRCAKVVLFAPTYNGGLYPKMASFIDDMAALNVQNRYFAVAENGTWAPASGKIVRAKLEGFKNCRISESTFTIKSALHDADSERLDAFVSEVAQA